MPTADRTVRWTGSNFDEVAALLRPVVYQTPSITAHHHTLTICDFDGKQHALPGDVISRGALGELHVFPAATSIHPEQEARHAI